VPHAPVDIPAFSDEELVAQRTARLVGIGTKVFLEHVPAARIETPEEHLRTRGFNVRPIRSSRLKTIILWRKALRRFSSSS
jgi:hypothetical protein